MLLLSRVYECDFLCTGFKLKDLETMDLVTHAWKVKHFALKLAPASDCFFIFFFDLFANLGVSNQWKPSFETPGVGKRSAKNGKAIARIVGFEVNLNTKCFSFHVCLNTFLRTLYSPLQNV
jgi:hypothetical protein